MANLLNGKSIVIIGGTSGIGLAASKSFIREGAKVLALGVPDGPQPSLGKNGFVLLADARQEGVAEHAIDRCIQLFGGFDGIYHVAGGSGRKKGDGALHELTLDGWNYTMELNLTSLMLSNKAAIRQLLKQKKGGVIVNTGSVLSTHPSAEFFATHAYAASKAAIVGLSKAASATYADKNIRINVIAPGLTDTPMSARAKKDKAIQRFIRSKQPLDGGRMAKPEDLNGMAVFLFSDSAQFITGQVIQVDGGWSVSEGGKSK